VSFEPIYLDVAGAREALQSVGVDLSERQIRRAAEMDGNGQRRLPFFLDPIEHRLKIEKSLLLSVYSNFQKAAIRDAQISLE